MRLFVKAPLAVVLALAASVTLPAAQADGDLAPKLRASLLKVHVTTQAWDRRAPWNKARPRTSWQCGVVVWPGLVLTPASRLTDQVFIEVSEANSARRFPASLRHADYRADLALVRIEDGELRKRMTPFHVGGPLTTDDEFEVWQLGASDLLERATGRVQKVASQGARLLLTTKTTLTDAGNGQLVVRNGHLAGLVVRTASRRQEGTVLAVETIHHYLEDLDGGDYRGFGAGGIWTHRLLRDDLRAHYGVPSDVHGPAVSRIHPGRTGHEVLREGDVLRSVAGHALDDEGMFQHPLHGRLDVAFLLKNRTHPGDRVPATVYRDGKTLDVSIPIRGWPAAERLMPPPIPGARPHYLVVGGLVVLELDTASRGIGSELVHFQRRGDWEPQGERKRITYAARVLADSANEGLEEVAGSVIATVNGRRISRIQDVSEALEHPVGGFHVFTFEGPVVDFVVKDAELEAIDRRIAERYGISELRYLGGK